MENGLVSVIMPAYNAAHYIEAAIDSVRSQSYTNWELIIVDDASKDETRCIVEKIADSDERIRFYINEENAGVLVTRARAASYAKGEWIAILDSDDKWTTDKLEKQLERQRWTQAELIYTASAFIDENDDTINYILHAPETISYRRLLKQNLISNSSVLVKKDLYWKYMLKENAGLIHEDFACWLKMLKNGIKAVGIDEPLLIYRITRSSKSGNKKKAAMMNWNTYRYCGLNPVASLYYMGWYMVKGVLKYRHLRKKS